MRLIPVAAAIFVGSMVTTLASASPAFAQSSAIPVTPSIVTSGTAEGKVTPDRAAIMVNVQTRAATAAAAASENARRTTAVLDALGKLGLPKSQLSTEGYSVQPEMVYGSGQAPRVTGYVVTNTVRA